MLVVTFIIITSRVVKPTKEVQGSVPPTFPDFSINDIFGRSFHASDFRGKYIYVQFIDPKHKQQMQQIRSIYNRLYKRDDINILVFVKNEEEQYLAEFLEASNLFIQDIIVVIDNYEKYKTLFRSPTCCETFYLFDDAGNSLISGQDWKLHKNKILTRLDGLKKGADFSIRKIIKPDDNIKNIGWLSQIIDLINQEESHEFYIISMFNEICTSCLTGKILNQLKKSYEDNRTSNYFIVFLSDDFTENDLRNFKKLNNIKCRVIRANKKMATRWRELADEWGKDHLNNIVFKLDETGEIVHVLNLEMPGMFFYHLNESSNY
jgi:hypothetical protein